MYGISFKGPEKTIVLAPGFGRTFLVQSDGQEVVLQADGTGKMQIIQASVDIRYILCIADSVIGFLQSLTLCAQNDPICLISAIISLFTDAGACANAVPL
jgi:hypothetical protein